MLPRALLMGMLLGSAAIGCGNGAKTPVSAGEFREAGRGVHAYPSASLQGSEVEVTAPSKILGSNIEPIGRLLDPGERLESLTLKALAAKSAEEVPGGSVQSELGKKLAAVFGPDAGVLRVFQTSLEPNELATAVVRMEPDRCYGIAAVEEGEEGLRVHVVAGPPWPPTVIAQSSLLIGAGSIEGQDGCLRSPDSMGFSAYLVVEGIRGKRTIMVGLFEAHN